MQNSYFDDECLKTIERICFSYIWNKKSDKTKSFERISRVKLKLPISNVGIGAPDVFILDKALKYRQVVRSTDTSCLHSINYIQKELLGFNGNSIFHKESSCEFINKACSVSNSLGCLLIDEILSCNEDSKLHKRYYDLVASENPIVLANVSCSNDLIKFQITSICKRFHFKNLIQLINEYKFPSTDKYRIELENIMRHPLFIKLLDRKCLTYDTCFRDGFFFASNQVTKSHKVTTKMIKNRLLLGTVDLVQCAEFRNLKKIKHPKEREIQFFKIHNVILSNDKLFKMKLVNSNICFTCNEVQDQFHIFNVCTNTLSADETIRSLELNYASKINILSLRDRFLFLNRDKIITSDMWDIVFKNRLNDCNSMSEHKATGKLLKDINKLTLVTGSRS